MIPKNQPAQIYDLNIGASIVGRNASPYLTNEDRRALQRLMSEFSNMFQDTRGEKPALVNTDESSFKQATAFSERIRRQLEGLQDYPKEVVVRLRECLDQFDAQARKEHLDRDGLTLDKEQVVHLLDIPEILDTSLLNEIVHNESQWTEQHHPDVLSQLRNRIDATQTRELIQACVQSLFRENIDVSADIYTQDTVDRYYLYWSTNGNGLDYATPSQYELATQLSFDIPHNAAHLLHLSFAGEHSVEQYIDRMKERTYTEAIAVLSEHQMYEQAAEQGEVIRSFSEILSIPIDQLSEWIKQDRSYEFRLRLARLLSDINTFNGKSFIENVAAIEEKLYISQKDATAEAQKYYAWTGLGAAYTLGYNRLLSHGIQNARDAMALQSGELLFSWEDFLDSK
ncbi:hypothetical protein IPN35_01580 [Candidatus Peregrinibacteria bacterium]|nr:MAG: hypothetical protein IPN35_01580 [Candidatus Peregrinibacteria bacterium]